MEVNNIKTALFALSESTSGDGIAMLAQLLKVTCPPEQLSESVQKTLNVVTNSCCKWRYLICPYTTESIKKAIDQEQKPDLILLHSQSVISNGTLDFIAHNGIDVCQILRTNPFTVQHQKSSRKTYYSNRTCLLIGFERRSNDKPQEASMIEHVRSQFPDFQVVGKFIKPLAHHAQTLEDLLLTKEPEKVILEGPLATEEWKDLLQKYGIPWEIYRSRKYLKRHPSGTPGNFHHNSSNLDAIERPPAVNYSRRPLPR